MSSIVSIPPPILSPCWGEGRARDKILFIILHCLPTHSHTKPVLPDSKRL